MATAILKSIWHMDSTEKYGSVRPYIKFNHLNTSNWGLRLCRETELVKHIIGSPSIHLEAMLT